MFRWDVESAPALPQTPKTIDGWSIESWTARMLNASFLWAATGDKAVLTQARKWLLGLCRCRAAADNSYSYGFYALALATAYDVLHDALSPAERKTVREHLAAVCQGLYESGTGRARGWWRRIYLHHDHWIPTAGLGVGALALKDEDPRWRRWYALARRELTLALSLLGEDGAWHEGVAGWCYGMALMLPFVEASRHVAGDDLYRFAWLRNTAQWRLHCRLPDGGHVFYGDSYRDGRYHGLGSTPSHLLRLLAARFRDGHAQWLAEQEEGLDLARLERARAERKADTPPRTSRLTAFYSVGWSLIWSDPAVKSVPPDDLPRHAVSDNLGYVVARTAWGRDAALLSFRAGPVAGRLGRDAALRLGSSFVQRMDDSAEHAHMDQNVITYFANGTYWLSPPGYGARHSARHTTLVINGRQQVKDSRLGPRLLRREFSGDCVYLLGDASTAYPTEVELTRFHRHLVWLKPDVVLICDDVRADKPVTVEWRLHPYRKLPPPRVDGNRIVLSASGGSSARTFVAEFLSPEKLTLIGSTKEPIPEELRQRKSRQRVLRTAYSVARTDVPAKRHLFLTVLGPGNDATKAVPLEVQGGVGVLVKRDGRRRAVIFFLEPVGSARDVRLAYTVPGPDVKPHLVVGLPAAVGLDVTETSVKNGSVTVAIAPGKNTQTSFEGTLNLD